MLRNNVYYKKKAQSIKRSGEEGIKNLIEVASNRNNKERQSLPRLDKRERLSMLWLMGPNSENEKLVNHLISKA